MALKAGYYGVKNNLLNKLKGLPYFNSIGDGLDISDDGELFSEAGSVIANGEGVPTHILNKLQVGDILYDVQWNDNTNCYQITDDTESAIVDADYIPFLDSSASSGDGAPKKSTWSNFCNKVQAKLTAFVDWAFNAKTGVHQLAEVYKNYAVAGSGSPDGYWIASQSDSITYIAKVENGETYRIHKKALGNRFRVIAFMNKPSSTMEATAVEIVNNDNLTEYIWTNSDGFNYLAFTANYNNSMDLDSIEGLIVYGNDLSNLYTSYAMTNRELTERIQKGTIAYTSSANTYIKVGSVDIPSGYSLIVAASNFNSACTGLLITSKDGTAVFGSDVAEVPAGFTAARKSCTYVNVGANVATVDIHAKNSGSNSETVKYVIAG